MDLENLLTLVKKTSILAGEVIMEIYNSHEFEVEMKGDSTPVTVADIKSDQLIKSKLKQTGFPVLSEEGSSIGFDERSQWDYLWIVDPLDGTKEFIKKNGEFTVNIALVYKNAPILGVVFVPNTRILYWGVKGQGSYQIQLDSKTTNNLVVNREQKENVRILCSRSHINDKTSLFIQKFSDAIITPMGSSLKFLKIAQGDADLYPKCGPTMEWDTAAADIILSEAGGKVLEVATGKPLKYNKSNLLNPHFIATNNFIDDLL